MASLKTVRQLIAEMRQEIDELNASITEARLINHELYKLYGSIISKENMTSREFQYALKMKAIFEKMENYYGTERLTAQKTDS